VPLASTLAWIVAIVGAAVHLSLALHISGGYSLYGRNMIVMGVLPPLPLPETLPDEFLAWIVILPISTL